VALEDALAALDRCVTAWLAHVAAPGAAVIVTDRTHTIHLSVYGVRDAAAGTPVADDDLFEIGSVGKAFAGAAALRLQERGLLSIDDPVTRHLPWFEVRSAYEPIRLWHLMTHSAGLVNGTDWTGEAEYEIRALRDTEATPAPGELHHYANAGYKALGLVLEAVTGNPVARVLEEEFLGPLGMAASVGAISNAVRRRLAPGHVPLFDDRAWRPAHGVAPATWLESTTADGSICATAQDMGRYLRMLLNRGNGDEGPVLTEQSFGLLVGRSVESPEYEVGSRYGLGLLLTDVDGHRWIGHGGSTVGYTCSMRVDVDEGFGAMLLTNGETDTSPIVRYALTLLRADRTGAEPPAPPPLPDEIRDAAPYAGTFASAGGTIEVAEAGGGLTVAAGAGAAVRLLHRDDGAFVADGDAWEPFPLRFRRRDGERAVAVTHGAAVYVREGETAPPAGAWSRSGFEGHYRSHDPWYSNLRIVDRAGQLVLIWGGGEEEPLALLPDGSFRAGEDPRLPERVRFEERDDRGPVLRVNYSGLDLFRTFTP
jgi:D-alanyl-D-alanine carboxypeptidase